MTAASSSPALDAEDKPRRVVSRVSGGDRVFRVMMRGAGLAVLVITGLILFFLFQRALSTFERVGFSFFTTQSFNPNTDHFGVAALLVNGLLVAGVALVIAIPVAVGTALYISEYAPQRLRRPLISLIDLMAAIPSIIYALWGLYFLEGRTLGVNGWLSRHLAFIPLFRIQGGPTTLAATYSDSPFVVGVVVSLLVIPIVTSLAREIFSQAPQAEREAAYALGATRWGMVRTVVLPFGRAGVIGSSMLGMGRALGDAIVISFLITPVSFINFRVLQSGGNSIPYTILLDINNGPEWVSALMAAGLVLFAMTLLVNVIGSIVGGRSRSGLVNVD
ncbi:MAG TPA: phosphate ABC transporter permease subunit PstC [Streptosporangiaceae bacterium]|jgi:phosphate transport system permease protein